MNAYFETDDDHKYRSSNILLSLKLVDCLFSAGFLVNTNCRANRCQATQYHVSLTGTSFIRYIQMRRNQGYKFVLPTKQEKQRGPTKLV
jgi:hypothetical protein